MSQFKFAGFFDISRITKYGKVILLQSDRLLLQSASGITKCDRLLLQNASGITKCDSYHKVRRNKRMRFGQLEHNTRSTFL